MLPARRAAVVVIRTVNLPAVVDDEPRAVCEPLGEFGEGLRFAQNVIFRGMPVGMVPVIRAVDGGFRQNGVRAQNGEKFTHGSKAVGVFVFCAAKLRSAEGAAV